MPDDGGVPRAFRVLITGILPFVARPSFSQSLFQCRFRVSPRLLSGSYRQVGRSVKRTVHSHLVSRTRIFVYLPPVLL
jgi:hypothetical protein